MPVAQGIRSATLVVTFFATLLANPSAEFCRGDFIRRAPKSIPVFINNRG